jgi:hypothetical protein
MCRATSPRLSRQRRAGVTSYKGDDEAIVYICGGLSIARSGSMVMMRWCISMSRTFRLCRYSRGDHTRRNSLTRIVSPETHLK